MAVHNHLHRHHVVARVAEPESFESAAAGIIAKAKSAIDGVFDPPASTSTSIQIVYKTASKTFAGPIGGYTTLGPVVEATPSATPTPSTTPSSTSVPSTSTSHSTTLQTSKSSALPSSIVPDTSTSVDSTLPLVAATGPSSSASSTLSAAGSSNTATTENATSSAVSKASDNGGMSTGGKIGLAIGIILLIGTVLALAAFCFMKRKRDSKRESMNEKTDDFAAVERTASTRTTANAPRLSLRPVTQFLPAYGERPQSHGNALAMTATPTEKQSAWERPMGGQDRNRNNPFGNHAENIDSTNANGPVVVNEVGPGGEIVSGLAAAPTGLTRGASKRGVKPIDFTKQSPFMSPPSPTGTEFSESSEAPGTPTLTQGSAAIAAAGGPANSAVHRVQLDFNPSMDDELEVKAGQLIRMLHEYDDGWALCIRLDRSRQGVVPRTCLSTRPVKPRPQQNGPRGPPPSGMRIPVQGSPNQPRPISPARNQGPRPISPAMNNGSPRPMTPNGGQQQQQQQARQMTPSGPQYTPQQRSMTPTGQSPRPMTPNGSPGTPNGQRPRAGSDAQIQAQRNSPPGSSPMNPSPPSRTGTPLAASGAVHRKPVGQAL